MPAGPRSRLIDYTRNWVARFSQFPTVPNIEIKNKSTIVKHILFKKYLYYAQECSRVQREIFLQCNERSQNTYRFWQNKVMERRDFKKQITIGLKI